MDNLFKLFTNDMQTVEEILADNIISGVSVIPNMSQYILSAGGKRIRPLLTLASASLINYTGEKHLYLAAAVECIHTATLLHDDVVDEAEERRGKTSARMLWGNAANVLVGDFLFSRSFQLMVQAGNMLVLDILSKASSKIAEGEVLQLMSLNNLNITEEHYFNIIERKTAELFAASCEVSGYLNNQPKNICENLRLMGLHLGIAFQIKDDLLDYTADSKKLGKTIGKDFFEGKITWPLLKLYNLATPDEKQFLEIIIKNTQKRQNELPTIIKMMNNYNILNNMHDKVIYHTNIAKDNLLALSGAGDVTVAIIEIMDSLAVRDF